MFNIIFFITIFFIKTYAEPRLEQVLILSRHGLRTPLSKELVNMTLNIWPKWEEKTGYLTQKGVYLEGQMGRFFSKWLYEKQMLLPGCPTEDVFYVYANSKQRTLRSANAFVAEAFPGCNITVHFNKENSVDPLFNAVIHNNSKYFMNTASMEMEEKLNLLHLNNSYDLIEDILNFKQSTICRKTKQCDLSTDKNEVYLKYDEKPNIFGPLKIGNSAIDAFLMAYYEGFPMNEVAWGGLRSDDQWKILTDLSTGYHSVIFNVPTIAKDIAEPITKYISTLFLNEAKPKITLLMGHDANILTVLKSLQFKPYLLPEQFESSPISGKIVFQKYYDEKTKQFLLKVDCVYQSNKQLRFGSTLSLKTPPKFETLEIVGCAVNKHGYCSWDLFARILNNI